MLLQLVVLAPKQASFASGGSVTTVSSSPLQAAYEQHHAAIGQKEAGLAALGEGYSQDAEVHQYVQNTNHTTSYKGRKSIVAMFAGLAKNTKAGAPASKVWDIVFKEDLRLVWVVVGNGPDIMLVDVLLFDEQYKIIRQYPAVMKITK
jgi:hypothetical protein